MDSDDSGAANVRSKAKMREWHDMRGMRAKHKKESSEAEAITDTSEDTS